MSTDRLALQGRMISLVRAFGLHRTDQTPCGQPVPISAAHALMELEQAQPLAQTDLAARLQLEKSTVSRLVRQLAQRDWLCRERDSGDGRVVRLRLTPAGQQVAEQLAAARADRFGRILEQLPSDRRAAVLNALDLLVEAIGTSA